MGLRCCEQAFARCGEWGLLSGCGTWASHCGARALERTGFQSCGVRGPCCPTACRILVPGPGVKPMSPALTGRFLTAGPPGKSHGALPTRNDVAVEHPESGVELESVFALGL